jgi:hypothetical protein
MVTLDFDGARTEAIAAKAGLRVRGGISTFSNRARFEDLSHAATSSERNKDWHVASILKDLDLKI